MKRWAAGLSFFLAVTVLCSLPAAAQDAGVRAGVSVDPDQFYFGGHLETAPLIDRLHFRPNLEIGLGDDVTVVAANMEFAYKFPPRSNWTFYAGGGPGLNVFVEDDSSDSEAAFNLLVGVERSSGLLFELKFGIVHAPDFKFGVGWTWR